jgi:RNA polymerase sigma-70 factor, ECF subfamily
LRSERPRFRPRADEARRLLDAFEHAIASGDATRFKALLADDVRFVSDGGGRIAAPRIVVAGVERVVKTVLGLIGKHPPPPGSRYERTRINGLPGLVVRGPDGRAIQTVALETDVHWRISALYIVRNPDKLQRL